MFNDSSEPKEMTYTRTGWFVGRDISQWSGQILLREYIWFAYHAIASREFHQNSDNFQGNTEKLSYKVKVYANQKNNFCSNFLCIHGSLSKALYVDHGISNVLTSALLGKTFL